ncbi:MAG: acylneuraminate cytidylyltransferase family protein [Pseudomonadota bacterium]
MSEDMSFIALMPMRHHSERVEGKNYRPFGDGRPLFFHALETLLSCEDIDRVVINTDSPKIKQLCAETFPTVEVIDRPEALLGGETPMNDILIHDVKMRPARFYVQTHSTNPLLTKQTVAQAVETFKSNYPAYDSLFSVTRLQARLWDPLARAVNHNPNILLRTQDLPPLYEENSCLYIFERETLLKDGARIGRRPYLFEMGRAEAIDIDEEDDFLVAEAVFRAHRQAS